MSDLTLFKENLNAIKSGSKTIKGPAKLITYCIIIITFLVGIIGSFSIIPFNMNNFISFIPVFSSLYIPLVLSIGVNSALEKKNLADIEKEVIKNGISNKKSME